MANMKYDVGKVPVFRGLFQYFPRALVAVAAISDYGFQKYKSWGGWRGVENGEERYSDANARHTLYRGIDGPRDPESSHLHRAHAAWNALAALELELEKLEEPKEKAPE